MNLGWCGCRYQAHVPVVNHQNLISMKKLLESYSDTAAKLKDALIDIHNQRVLTRALGQESEKLRCDLEELQRSVVSRALVVGQQ